MANYAEYFEQSSKMIADPKNFRLKDTQIELAWNYAYRFFFQFPRPFPWRLMKFWEDLKEWPVQRVLSQEGLTEFGKTFHALAGEAIDW